MPPLSSTLHRHSRFCSAGGAVLWGVDRATFRHIIVSNTNEIRKTHESHLLKMAIFEGMSESDVAKVADALFQSERSCTSSVLAWENATGFSRYMLAQKVNCSMPISRFSNCSSSSGSLSLASVPVVPRTEVYMLGSFA